MPDDDKPPFSSGFALFVILAICLLTVVVISWWAPPSDIEQIEGECRIEVGSLVCD